MTDDLFSFATTHARRVDPDTSHDAAARAESLAAQHGNMIAGYLKSILPAGATVEQIGNGVGLDSHRVGKRMKELAIDNRAHHDGVRMMSTGREGRVWFSLSLTGRENE